MEITPEQIRAARALLRLHQAELAERGHVCIVTIRRLEMLAVPPAVLDLLNWQAGTTVGLAVEGGRLIVEPQLRPRYTLDELLAQCDPSAEPTQEDHEWLDARPVGDELW